MTKRQEAYSAIPHCIDTTNLSVQQVAEAIVNLWQGERGDRTPPSNDTREDV
jgi:hypothetical protein